MNIALIAQNSKKVLLENFCIAFKGILRKHTLHATGMTGKRIETATGLSVTKFHPGALGGDDQIVRVIERNELDLVIFFHNDKQADIQSEQSFDTICRACDKYNIPLATNIATAESLILCLDHGDMEWRM